MDQLVDRGGNGGDSYQAEDGNRQFVTALARGLEVLRAFRVRDGFLGNSEIAERTGLPKPTVSRLTYTLCRTGYLTKIPRLGKYQLAPSAITLGYSALANLGIRHIAKPFMQETADRLSAPIALGIQDRDRALYVEICRGSATFTVQLEIGSRVPLAKTAMGWAILAELAETERLSMFEKLEERHNGNWPEMQDKIESAIERYRECGFVTAVGTWKSDINAVGVPLVTADGSGIFAFNFGGSPHHFTERKMETIYGPALRDMVARIECRLNGGIA